METDEIEQEETNVTVMTVDIAEWVEAERVEAETVADVPCDERCVWCEIAQDVAHTVDGFCEFCGATGHPCR